MTWQVDDQALSDIEGALEEWAAITNMANMLAMKLPVGLTRDAEATAGPSELWRLGVSMAALSSETRYEVAQTIQRLLMIVRERRDGQQGVSQRRGMLRLAAGADAS